MVRDYVEAIEFYPIEISRGEVSALPITVFW